MHNHDLRAKLSIPVGPNASKELIFHKVLRTMEDSKILESMKNQDIHLPCKEK